MSDYIRSLVKKHHAFYEVFPYYAVVIQKHGNLPDTIRRIHAGFDVDIYGVNTKNDLALPGPDPDYAVAYATLQNIAEKLYAELRQVVDKASHHTGDSCALDVMPFPSSIVFDRRDHAKVEAMFRIRISHFRGLDQPAGLPEQHALDEVEKELRSLGIARR